MDGLELCKKVLARFLQENNLELCKKVLARFLQEPILRMRIKIKMISNEKLVSRRETP